MSASAVAKLTDAVAELQTVIGVADARKLLLWLAEGLGAPDKEVGPERASTRPEPGRPSCEERPADASGPTLHGKDQPARKKVGRVRALKLHARQ